MENTPHRRDVARVWLGFGELARLMLDSTREAIYAIDSLGDITSCNSAGMQLLGYKDPAEVIGKNLHNIIHHTHPDGTSHLIGECPVLLGFRRGECSHADDQLAWRSDGTSFPAEYWFHPIEKNNLSNGAVVTVTDISE